MTAEKKELTPERREALRLKLQERMEVRIRSKPIRAINVNSSYHWQPPMHIEVGRSYANLEFETPPDKVLAIFESTVFLVCTLTRGVEKGFPYMFARTDVTLVEGFDK